MAIRSLAQLKSYFMTGLYPTQQQFHDVFDSFFHKNENIGIEKIEGLSNSLNNKYNTTDAAELATRLGDIEEDLNTTAEAIQALEAERKRTYTLDFQTDTVLLQDVNIAGSIVIDKIFTRNVATLRVSHDDVVQQVVALSGSISIEVSDNQVITWEITRQVQGELACVGVRYLAENND